MTRALAAGAAIAIAWAPFAAAAQAERTTPEPQRAPAQEAPPPESAPTATPGQGQAAPTSTPARVTHVDGWNISLNNEARRGAKIESIDGSSPAGAMLQPGDVVIGADGAKVRDAGELARVLGAVPVGQPVLLDVVRGGRVRSIGIQIPPPERTAPATPSESRVVTPPATLYPDIPAIPPPAPETKQPMVVVVPSGGGSLVFGGGGGTETLTAVNPPAYSAPGVSILPGATFAPGPGTSAFAAPQIPGVSQPPGFLLPLGFAPIAGPAGGPAPILGNATTTTTGTTSRGGSGSGPASSNAGSAAGAGNAAGAGMVGSGAAGLGGRGGH